MCLSTYCTRHRAVRLISLDGTLSELHRATCWFSNLSNGVGCVQSLIAVGGCALLYLAMTASSDYYGVWGWGESGEWVASLKHREPAQTPKTIAGRVDREAGGVGWGRREMVERKRGRPSQGVNDTWATWWQDGSDYSVGLVAIQIAKESIPGMEIALLDISELPFLNIDLEVDGRFPEAMEEFRKRFLEADCILFSTLEYNYSVTG
eukprot:Gb_25133 [translate_table: standard]